MFTLTSSRRLALALLSLAPVAAAQVAHPKYSRYRQPMQLVRLDLETGRVQRGPATAPQAVVTATDLDNLDLGGFIGVDTGGGFCEWIDSAYKGAGAGGTTPVASDLVSNFVFAYCSSRLDVNSGGVGGTMTWSFFPSHTTGAPHPATSDQVAAITLTGLPSNTTEGALFAQIACYFIDIQLGTVPLAFPDGQIGYSWTFEDLDTVGVFAATFPFLSCVQSCSGSGPDGWSMDDVIDMYCPANVPGSHPLVPFVFSTPMYWSINIDMRELDVAGTALTFDGPSVVNPDRLHMSPAVIGSGVSATVTPQIDRAGTPGFDVAVLMIYAGCSTPGVPIVIDLAPILIGFGSAPVSELLTSGSLLALATVPLNGPGVPSAPRHIDVPLDSSLLCHKWSAQAIVFGDVTTDGVDDLDPMFTNGVTGDVGSH